VRSYFYFYFYRTDTMHGNAEQDDGKTNQPGRALAIAVLLQTISKFLKTKQNKRRRK
jgi:hypothetical protein